MTVRTTNSKNLTSSLSDEIYKALCADVADGVFKPGDRLGIEMIARMKGVSPIPVREALQRMVRDGLVTQNLNRGFRVKVLSKQDGQEIRAIRVALETLAVSWLMKHGKVTPELIAGLRECCEAYRQCNQVRGLCSLDLKFHSIIIDHCGSWQLQDILSRRMILLNSFYLSNGFTEIPSLSEIERCYKEHVHIADCIEAGDVKLAEKALRNHLE